MYLPILIILFSSFGLHTASANSDEVKVDLESQFLCRVQGDNTTMRLSSGTTSRVIEINKTNDEKTQLDEFEVGCHRTESGLKCSDYLNIAQVQIKAHEVQESCSFWKDQCLDVVLGELTYRQKNFMGLRATQVYEIECEFRSI